MAENKPTKAPEKFIRLLKKAMDAHADELSLRKVAQRADISPAYLSLLLSGDRGVPSNEAIAQLENVLGIPKGELNAAAGKPNDKALEFFRKEQARPIMHKLGLLQNNQLAEADRMLDRLLQKQNRTKGK
jgi:transcriptional regulator with XRE-family HTH domain